MTPDAGYIKFVPGAVSLSRALAQSNGDPWRSGSVSQMLQADPSSAMSNRSSSRTSARWLDFVEVCEQCI